MGFTTLQNTPIEIDLLALVNDNGWSFTGTELVHESCNFGTIVNKKLFLQTQPYDLTIKINSISGGYLEVGFGSFSQQYTTSGLKQISVTSTTANPQIRLTSNANTRVEVISIMNTSVVDNTDSTDNIVYFFHENFDNPNEGRDRWERFDNYYPDFAMSMFTNLYSYKNGQMYSHTDKTNKNWFYGTQYESRIKAQFVQPQVVNYQSIKLECNELLITTEDGVVTSLGQVSDLIEQDFEMFSLDDGVNQVTVYDYEGNYRANFLKAKPDLNFGDRLKGRYVTIEITTKDQRDFNLYKVVIQYNISTPNE